MAARKGRRSPSDRARPAADPLPEAGSAALARARTAFLAEGTASADVVREPILASWTRSRHREIPVDHLEVPFETDVDGDSVLLRASRAVLAEAAEHVADEAVSLVLCDADGVVLTRDTGDRALARTLDRVWLAPGFSYAERHVGTNGIGVALEAGGPARVFGHEHYVERLEHLACVAVPVRHPLTHRTLGVVNLTGWQRDAGAMMVAATAALARRIETSLLEQSGRREHALLRDYLTACRRTSDPVIAVGADLLMLNDRARELLAPADHGPLLAEAVEALATGRRRQLLVDLPSGPAARVVCAPSFSDGRATGGIVHVSLIGRPALTPAPQQVLPPPSTAVGTTPAWLKCRAAVDRAFAARAWLVLEGEPGTGRTTLARAAHRSRTPGAHLRVVDAARGARLAAELADELSGPRAGGTLVLAHLDRLPPEETPALVDLLEPLAAARDDCWVVATVDPHDDGDRAGHLAPLLALFPRTVEVPPLRHRIEDVAELVPHLLGRLTRGTVTAPPSVVRALMRNRWPGNVAQLQHVLRVAAARRRTGSIEVDDLPPECRATTRRVLSPIEAIECDAIVEALRDTEGNKSEAARRLGMSRATIYRKMRGYGLSDSDDD